MKAETAFEMWILERTTAMGTSHILDCLINGEQDNAAWDLLDKINGEGWSCDPRKLFDFVADSIERFKESNLAGYSPDRQFESWRDNKDD